jgi:hypothetical protein
VNLNNSGLEGRREVSSGGGGGSNDKTETRSDLNDVTHIVEFTIIV